ncbi:MAG TPA: VTT domain-containing protein [Kofleriaceae bacterium]|nr:VTT domain-containing protein [Kofleriaceae bacterium]
MPVPVPVPTVTGRRVLLAVLAAAFVAGAAWAYGTGRMTAGSIEAWLASLGPAAPALFVGAFVAGSMIGLPGMVFVVGGRLAFGAETGFVLGYGGGVLACLVPFATARGLRGGRAATPWQPRNRHLRRALELVEARPLRAILLLRLVLWFNPPLSYTLAVTGVSTRVYAIGCALALAPVVAVAVVATGWFV